jgi:hypothetical protein
LFPFNSDRFGEVCDGGDRFAGFFGVLSEFFCFGRKQQEINFYLSMIFPTRGAAFSFVIRPLKKEIFEMSTKLIKCVIKTTHVNVFWTFPHVSRVADLEKLANR